MVGTRHAVSDNKSESGLGMPSPYIPERGQIKDDKVGLKRKTENYHTPSALCASVQRRTGECSPQRVQKHIQCFF